MNARLAGLGDWPRVTGLSMGMTLGLYGWTVCKNGLRDRSSLLLQYSVVWVGCLGLEVKDWCGACSSVAFNFNHKRPKHVMAATTATPGRPRGA